MAPLNAASEAAIARLRSYVPPPTAYSSVPLSRRAAVLILLYADAKGDLRVVVTIRAKTLSSYAGEAALPGGRADTLQETPFQTARREASEEIGLPEDEGEPSILPPFRVEHLCELPANLAKTELVVRPCVALLHGYDPVTGLEADPEVSLIPKLDAREVAAVFTAPFRDFLSITEDVEWYRGSWSLWHDSRWRMHQFFVPSQTVKHRSTTSNVKVEGDTRYRVFGMTARMLVDAARVAYAQEPEFEHNSHFGDEAMIAKLRRLGRLSAVRKASDGLTRETMEKASKLS
ncbi:hypothetical protein N7499_004988 [Penicillium canescens]|nr:hypothetical protein N7522_004631 [Penicillium canescens]KAJ6040167.1 hypothetical protein N7444_009072 [Penicillium canescens]KAJ6085359.1 hypothetical protein N7499_004988 [Penicillium canescens]KAJ6162138.1 hypothetical protein N7485_010368 [Penicillium canescens]